MKQSKYVEGNIYNVDTYKAIKDIPNNSIDLIIMDPPYKIDVRKGGGIYGRGRQNFRNEIATMSEGINKDIFDEICRIMKKINIYIFCNKEQVFEYLYYFFVLKKCSFDILSWHKLHPIPACNNKYLPDTEYILFFREKGVKLYGNYYTKSKYYITEKNVKEKRKYGHPTIKPLKIIENLIINSSNEEDVVFDPFIGSGTTAVASKLLNRKYMGFEINPVYFQTAKSRVENTFRQEELQFER